MARASSFCLFFEDIMDACVKRSVSSTHRLVGADGMDLSPEHDGREDEEEETLEAQEDEEDDGRRWREAAALWKQEERIVQSAADGKEQKCASVPRATHFPSLPQSSRQNGRPP